MTHAAPNAVSPGSYSPPLAATHSAESRTTTLRILAYCGFSASILFIVGIVLVSMIPDQMDAKAATKTIAEIFAKNRAEVVAGWMFAVGLTALVPFFWMLVRTLDENVRVYASVGAMVFGVGAMANVVGSLTMVVLGHFMPLMPHDAALDTAASLFLGLGITIDALYNLTLAVALVLIGSAMRSSAWPRWTRRLAMYTGVLSLPVAFEWYSRQAAAAQFLSGTLFIVWIMALSVIAIRRARG